MVLSTATASSGTQLEKLRPKEVPERFNIPSMNGGMRADKVAADLANNELADVVNLHHVNGRLGVRLGNTEFAQLGAVNIGTNLTKGSYIGSAAATYQLEYAAGTLDELLLTTQTLYRWASAVGQWQLVSYGQSFLTSQAHPTGVNGINLTSVASLVAGQIVGLILDDGSQLISTIVTILGNVVFLNDAIPFGRSSPAGAGFARAAAYTGDTSAKKQIVGVTFPGTGAFIFSNGVNPIQTYFNGLVTDLTGFPATPVTCQAMCVAHEQLLIGNLVENGVSFPTRVRASDQADATVWAPGSGIAAVYNLDDTPDPIRALKPLGPYVVVYRHENFMRGTYLGVPNQTWFWEYAITTEGVVSQGAVVDLGSKHFVVGHSGVYLYSGGFSLETIGDAVFKEFLAPRRDIISQYLASRAQHVGMNPDVEETLFTVFVPAFDECWIVYAQEGDLYPRTQLTVVLENHAWFRAQLGSYVVSAAPYVENSSVTWNTAVGTWAQQTGQWNSQTKRANVSNIRLCPPGGSAPILVFDYAAITDDGAAIHWELVTKQFGDTQNYTRWEDVAFFGTDVLGGTVVQYSTDEGTTWTTFGDTLSFGTSAATRRFNIDLSSLHMQFKLFGVDPGFSLRSVSLTGILDSEW